MIDTPYITPTPEVHHPRQRALVVFLVFALLAIALFFIIQEMYKAEPVVHDTVPMIPPPEEGAISIFSADVQEQLTQVQMMVSTGEITQEEGDRLTDEIVRMVPTPSQ